MNRQDVYPGLGIGFDTQLRLFHHEMGFEGPLRGPPHGLDHDHAIGQLRNESPIHDVEMKPGRTGRLQPFDLPGEVSKVAQQKRRQNDGTAGIKRGRQLIEGLSCRRIHGCANQKFEALATMPATVDSSVTRRRGGARFRR